MHQHLSLNVGPTFAVFDRELEAEQLERVLAVCTFELEAKGFRGRRTTVTKCLYDIKKNRLPSGLVARVADVLPGLVVVVPKYRFTRSEGTFSPLNGVTLRHYQETAVALLTAAGRGVAKIPTGCGKSLISAALAGAYPGKKVLVTVPSVRLMRQTSEDIEAALGESVSVFGDKSKDLSKRIIVATIQSLGSALSKAKKAKKGARKCKTKVSAPTDSILDRLSEVDVWICDEAHGSAAETYTVLGEALTSCWHRYGLTATWQREDGLELVMEGVLGRELYEYPYTQAFKEGFLTPPTIVWQRPPSNVVWFQDTYHAATNEQYVHHIGRHLKLAADVATLLEAGVPNVLVLVDRLEQGSQLAEVLGAPFVNGASDQDSLEQALLDLNDGRLRVLVASGILNVGVNIPALAAVVNACGGKSRIEAAQKVGRGLRLAPGKTRFLYLEYADEEPRILKKHAGTRRLWYSRLFGPSANVDIGFGRLGRFLEAM